MEEGSADAYLQDDYGARAALLAWLEGRLPMDEAVATYVSCFPPVAGMRADHVKATWSGWSAARRRMLARQIRMALDKPS